MRRPKQQSLGLQVVILTVIVALLGLSGEALRGAQTTDISLLLEQIPTHGGTITPEPGVYYFKPDAEIILTAAPRPGYQFVCWLGDVSDRTASRTVAYLNKPKVIIAVFQKTDSDNPLTSTSAGGGGSSGAAQFAGGGFVEGINHAGLMIGGTGPKKYKPPALPILPQITKFTLPAKSKGLLMAEVPDTSTQTEQTIPEPATGILLIFGSLFTFVRATRTQNSTRNSQYEIRSTRQPYSNL